MFIILVIIFSLSPPVLMIMYGVVWKIKPPKTISRWYGYRTAWARKSQLTWDFAQRSAASNSIYAGIVLGIMYIVLWIALINSIISLGSFCKLFVATNCAVGWLSMLPTEIALRKRFEKNGDMKWPANDLED